MNSERYREFIRRIPKTHLHVHLDGSLRLDTLIELAREHQVPLPSETPSGLRERVFKSSYADLPDYLRGFAYTTAALRTPEALERVAYELAEDNWNEGVRYIEVRFAPQLHVTRHLTVRDTIAAVARGLDRAKRRFNDSDAVRHGEDLPFDYGLIVCAMRCFNGEMSLYYHRLLDVLRETPKKEAFAIASLEMARAAVEARDRDGLPVVGFDLAGEEAGYPAAVHRAAYRYAHTHFLKKTVHAGEAYGPESIFQAITECHANRIGHGTFLFAHEMVRDPEIRDPQTYVHRLAEYIASERITIEVCLTSNLQTIPSIRRPEDHPLRTMIEHELSVSICTDNRLVSNTSVSQELERVFLHLNPTPHQFRNLVIAGFKGSFYPGTYREKRAWVRRVIDRYERIECEMMSG